VPTFAGFDPRLQLLHEDAAEAVVRSTMVTTQGSSTLRVAVSSC
jgi:hypothetical protein